MNKKNSLVKVLNLVINGLPSILLELPEDLKKQWSQVLNLVINGLPSILLDFKGNSSSDIDVLNLVINGLPSILVNGAKNLSGNYFYGSFKPCYKWITFNTQGVEHHLIDIVEPIAF